MYPVFVQPGRGRRDEIVSMPGQHRLSIDLLPKLARDAGHLGLGGLILFGLPDGVFTIVKDGGGKHRIRLALGESLIQMLEVARPSGRDHRQTNRLRLIRYWRRLAVL